MIVTGGSGVSFARENVQDHAGGVNALGQRFGAGGFHHRQSIGENGGKDRHHLAVAVIGAAQFAVDTSKRRG